MAILNKRYCSHCGTPNPVSNCDCDKCGKSINSALKSIDDSDEDVIVVKRKRPTTAKQRIVYEDDEDFEEIATPSFNDIKIEQAGKLTVASLANGAQIPVFNAIRDLPNDVEIKSRVPFFQPKFD